MTVFLRITLPARVLLLAGLLCAAGCGGGDSVSDEPPAPNADQSATSDPAPDTDSKSDAAAVSLDVLNASETDELIASHKGKIVVVDLWALW
jgi:hypothetical protein